MALYIPHSIFHLARLLYVRPGTFGPYYVAQNQLCNYLLLLQKYHIFVILSMSEVN